MDATEDAVKVAAPPPSSSSRAHVSWWALVLLASGCASIPNRDPTGEIFPTVQGTTLSSQATTLPLAVQGKPSLLLVAYDQDAQFDVDRWVLGVLQLKTPIEQLFEVPTVAGVVPTVLAGVINSGMRSGIPSEDWASVCTVYSDGAILERFTGTERGLNARVVLLDATGKVIWFHDRGFSPSVAMKLDAKVRELNAISATPTTPTTPSATNASATDAAASGSP
jgi:hypothetical protein